MPGTTADALNSGDKEWGVKDYGHGMTRGGVQAGTSNHVAITNMLVKS